MGFFRSENFHRPIVGDGFCTTKNKQEHMHQIFSAPNRQSFTPNESQLGLNGALDLAIVKAERSKYIRLVWIPSPLKILTSIL